MEMRQIIDSLHTTKTSSVLHFTDSELYKCRKVVMGQSVMGQILSATVSDGNNVRALSSPLLVHSRLGVASYQTDPDGWHISTDQRVGSS